ncbi:phenylalanyl-tRNA synthetase beta subunit [Thermus arciformis]|uniref:Phenylalanine--tRNA ligase beta subunit n=1 Tax=Thermus arciformis TaxID=482827 RepID=A0A1G7I6J9_9DEIN|nr:phenylalanine--tRNA ligase subunit beta [Thermus arciformis]SDF08357.1 phenylalanyl-tRNA synthetase beta subunit [Thermus arciformis]
MRVPFSWLKQYVPELESPEVLEERLAGLGFETDRMERLFRIPQGVVFARVLEAHPIPGTRLKRLVLEAEGVVEVVSGAENARKGIGVALALPGTELPGLGQKVGERVIQGVRSFGMALSPKELGVGEYGGGLLELPEDALPPGTPLAEAWPEEVVLDLEVTPNRPDALGLLGLARDLHALGYALVEPEAALRAEALPLPFALRVEDPEGAPHFTLAYAFGLKVGPSPLWMQRALFAAGMRPISNVVDVTNYVMLERAQPMHAFDLRFLGEGILVRRARPGERLRTLDGVERTLSPEDLVIAGWRGEESFPLGLAGVMGGAESEVREDTEAIALEVACFDPVSIRKTARRHGLRTEASHRFERGVDPLGQLPAQRRALSLLQALAGARVAQEILEEGRPKPPEPIPFRPHYANRLLGTAYPEAEQVAILKRLGCRVEGEGPAYWVTPPSHRLDLRLEEDLVEEVARIQGYETIPLDLPAFFPAPDNRGVEGPYRRERALKELLAGLGFQEVYTYSFADPQEAPLFRLPPYPLRLQNPLAPEKAALRTHLFPGLVRVLKENLDLDRPERALLFEVGRVYGVEGDRVAERTHLAGLLFGEGVGLPWEKEALGGFFLLKGHLEALLARLGLSLEVEAHPYPFLHPGVSGRVRVGGEERGFLGELHPEIARALELPRVWLFELRLPLPEAPFRFQDPSRYPPAFRDLAVVVPEATPYGEVERLLREAAGPHLESLELFDLYQGPPLKPGEKSLAFHLRFRHPERTLRDEEVEAAMAQVVAALKARGFGLRE